MTDRLEGLAQRFRRYGEFECRGSSPLYERLSLAIAEDIELLEIASHARRDQPLPNLFFGAVHLLLLQGAEHDLVRYFPNIAESDPPDDDPLESFRDFCLSHRDEITQVISTRRTQTNVVERCAILLPAFAMVHKIAGGLPLAMVEIGTSAGVNLLWDKYGYDYGGGIRSGDPASPVQIVSEFRGPARPALPDAMPQISHRVGIDVSPIDADDDGQTMWLRALVWPEHRSRQANLDAALEMVRYKRPRIIKGDAVEMLPDVLADAPADAALCVYHSHTMYQLSPESRNRLDDLLKQHSRTRPVYRVSSESRLQVQGWLTADSRQDARPNSRADRPPERLLDHRDAGPLRAPRALDRVAGHVHRAEIRRRVKKTC